jgi:hypothetical protein
MATDPRIIAWRAAGKHLPPMLRDFHDQKEVFKLVDSLTTGTPDASIRRPTWVEGHVYVIDTFLWCMARHGYTLQRSRARLPFECLSDNAKALRDREAAVIGSILGATNGR